MGLRLIYLCIYCVLHTVGHLQKGTGMDEGKIATGDARRVLGGGGRERQPLYGDECGASRQGNREREFTTLLHQGVWGKEEVRAWIGQVGGLGLVVFM